MDIISLVNEHGKLYSPYKGKLINNLAMGQLALFKISGNIKKVESLTEQILKIRKIDKVKNQYPKINSIDKCLGKRELYESCLDLVKEDLTKYDRKAYISKILNTYKFGMSSGIYHPLIRVYYAVDAFEKEEELVDEVARSLAYYITSYRQGKLFTREIDKSNIIEEAIKMKNNINIRKVLEEKTMGKRIRALYNNEEYMKLGFIVKGTADEKVKSLLELLIPTYINSKNSFVAFHCITGLQALVGLKNYYDDYERAIDILTTTIITHLLTVDKLNFTCVENDRLEYSWEYIISMASQSTRVHNIKLANSCRELYEVYPMKQLKTAVLKKIDTI